jgi:putative membrane protein
MLVASPLLVLGKPLVAFLRALPADTARKLVAATRAPLWQRIWRFLVTPGIAFALHALALWIWHLPSWFEAALASDTIHALQHLSFVSTALLFWWADMHGEQRMARYGAALLFLFATALHTGLLGALLAFSGHAFYPTYLETSRSWGIDAHSDQQLGGLIMWIPACALYIFAALALCVGWLRAAERGVERWEAALPADLPQEGSAP